MLIAVVSRFAARRRRSPSAWLWGLVIDVDDIYRVFKLFGHLIQIASCTATKRGRNVCGEVLNGFIEPANRVACETPAASAAA